MSDGATRDRSVCGAEFPDVGPLCQCEPGHEGRHWDHNGTQWDDEGRVWTKQTRVVWVQIDGPEETDASE